MNVRIIGGGPGGLYTAILLKKLQPDADIAVYERNRADDTFGWGVVFSDETMGGFGEADPETHEAILNSFRHWDDVTTHFRGEVVQAKGHGYSAMGRLKLLQIFQERAAELGVVVHYETDIDGIEQFADADLIVAADGINSKIRGTYAEHFKPQIDVGKSKFTWLGSSLPLENFTFFIKEHEHGLFQVHAYPFNETTSTFIVETSEETWHKAGLEGADEAATLAFCENLFADELKGHKLLANKSQWINFRRVKNETWFKDNIVLIGDAAHTAHYSIGSGTKLAMEDAIELARALSEQSSVEAALQAYQDARWVDCAKLQKTAETSRHWFEDLEMLRDIDPTELAFSLLTRSKRVTHDNLRQRDPEYVAGIDRWFASKNGMAEVQPVPPPMFTPFSLRKLTLPNRVVVSPMCQYQAVDGVVGDWHMVHLGARALGGAGLIITEMTDVSPEGRISLGCCGLWNDEQQAGWTRIVDFVHAQSPSKIGIQLAHAGRKASCALPWEGGEALTEGGWQTIAPSAVGYEESDPTPKAMDRGDMDRVRDAFVAATKRADAAGFDLVEVHMAHGYLLSTFLSPLCNLRDDEYGGSVENRLRFPLEVFDAMRAVWPEDKPMSVRISASDWCEGGMDADQAVAIATALKEHGCDIVDVSAGGNVTQSEPVYGRMFQTPFSHRIRREVGIPTMAVGAIQGWDHVNTIVASGRADLCAMARPHLADPHLSLHAAAEQGWNAQPWPNSYLAAKPRA